MNIFLDYESYYENGTYTLRKMSIEEYVRDPRFELHLLGVAVDDQPVQMVPAHLIRSVLTILPLDDPNTWVYMQNAKFDAFITEDYLGIKIANPICTRAMARWTGISRLTRESQAALCEFLGTHTKGGFIESMSGRHIQDLTQQELFEYKRYCTGDVEGLRQNVNKMLPHMTMDALHQISMTTRMYTQSPFILNKPMLEEYHGKLELQHQTAMDRLKHLFKFPTTEAFLKAIRSKDKCAALFQQIGAVVPYKVSAAQTATRKKQLEEMMQGWEQSLAAIGITGTDLEVSDHTIAKTWRAVREQLETEDYVILTPALAKKDLEFMALQRHENPDIAALATARAENNSSIAMSRCETFLGISRRGVMPVPLECWLAGTGRYTGGTDDGEYVSDGINLQNLAKRTGDKTLRKCINVAPGMLVVAGDSSQIECRTGAWLACEQQLLDDFANKRDPYANLASDIYSVAPEKILHYTKGEGKSAAEAPKYKTMRNVGKEGILSSQYGIGAAKYALRLSQQGIHLSFTEEDGTIDSTPAGHLKEATRANKIYRTKYAMIKQFWKTCENVLVAMLNGNAGYFGGPQGNTLYYDGQAQVFGRTVPSIMLPNGYWIRYPNLRTELNEHNKPSFVYDQFAKGRVQKKHVYGGLVFNNCIAQDVEVYTWRGWVPIQNVLASDRIFDGDDFYYHGGVVYKHNQQCIEVQGVRMTPDHLVWTGRRWKKACEIKKPATVEALKGQTGNALYYHMLCSTPVYDILDCGPRNRFVVRGTGEPMIVHNCNQGLAFAILSWQAVQMHTISRIPMHINIHDAWGSVVPEAWHKVVEEIYYHWLRQCPPWAQGIPIDCEVESGYDFTVV